MPTVVVGYGQYNNYRLTEIPTDLLLQLSLRYPLAIEPTGPHPDQRVLIIIVAIHAELQRRQSGGLQEKHLPGIRELAAEIIEAGCREVTLKYDPAGNYPKDRKNPLSKAREELQRLLRKVSDDSKGGGAISIPAEGKALAKAPLAISYSAVDYDEDVPF
ncbi:MAG: hypothetical protein HY820_13700 [Acidobacteria bacterium]|nr:hypothetical protein [Acidobacteriota bacterium]